MHLQESENEVRSLLASASAATAGRAGGGRVIRPVCDSFIRERLLQPHAARR